MADTQQPTATPATRKGIIASTQLTAEGVVMVVITVAVPPDEAAQWVTGTSFDLVRPGPDAAATLITP